MLRQDWDHQHSQRSISGQVKALMRFDLTINNRPPSVCWLKFLAIVSQILTYYHHELVVMIILIFFEHV
jgi:hypothetical protein